MADHDHDLDDPLLIITVAFEGGYVVSAPVHFWMAQPNVRTLLRAIGHHPPRPPVPEHEWLEWVASLLDGPPLEEAS